VLPADVFLGDAIEGEAIEKFLLAIFPGPVLA
jgi:hypothetical protein